MLSIINPLNQALEDPLARVLVLVPLTLVQLICPPSAQRWLQYARMLFLHMATWEWLQDYCEAQGGGTDHAIF